MSTSENEQHDQRAVRRQSARHVAALTEARIIYTDVEKTND